MARPKQTPIQDEARKAVKENVRRLLKNRGMSQIELAERTGIPKQTINGYANGTSLPTPGNTEKISQFFNVPKDEVDPRFKTISFKDQDLEEVKKKLSEDESKFFEQLVEKALSLDEQEKEVFYENVRFAVEFFDKKNK